MTLSAGPTRTPELYANSPGEVVTFMLGERILFDPWTLEASVTHSLR